jgi:SAM-dependent methyltransferase
MSSSPIPLPKKIRKRLGDIRRRLRARPSRTCRQKERLLADSSLPSRDRELLSKTESLISPDDGMYKGDGGHYFRVGLSAIKCIDSALTAAGIEQPQKILDLPCGHGRVLRFLRHRFPQAAITACDLETDGVDFCTETFQVSGVYSKMDLSSLSLGTHFDLIWCGSLLTHLDQRRIVALLEFFQCQLTVGGLLIFTAAGDRVADWMLSGEFGYGIAKSAIPLITSAYRDSGYAYTDYAYMPDYGISLTSPEWLRKCVKQVGSLREVYYAEHGWDNHQDVYGFVKETSAELRNA